MSVYFKDLFASEVIRVNFFKTITYVHFNSKITFLVSVKLIKFSIQFIC